MKIVEGHTEKALLQRLTKATLKCSGKTDSVTFLAAGSGRRRTGLRKIADEFVVDL
jgi:hypothetical protein